METLVVVSHHRNHHHYYGRNRSRGLVKFGSFGSDLSGNFAGISCRSFQSNAGLLPTPFKSLSPHVTKNAFSTPLSPKTPSPYFSENKKGSNRNAKSVPIPINFCLDNDNGDLHFSERWAGPAYSNSPPPSSLPLPKFSLQPKRTVSLDLPRFDSEIDMHPFAKSCPASPTRGHSLSPRDLFDSADSATKTLRRILNLDVANE